MADLETLPDLLAGPILRRTTPDEVTVWFATSIDAVPSVTIRALTEQASGFVPAEILSRTEPVVESHRLGRRLWIHLVRVRPLDPDGFPRGRMLGYEVGLGGRGSSERLARALSYGRFPSMSFFIPEAGGEQRILYGSCRKAHGRGPDALAYADDEIAAHASDPVERPAVLFLMGDQIYADDVPGPLIGPISSLAETLVPDEPPVPGMPSPLSSIPLYRRADLVANEAGFTSGEAANHLLGFGEYMAMTLMLWNPELWPALVPKERAIRRPQILIGNNHKALESYWDDLRRYEREYHRCERLRRSLGQVRRVLANCPCYMVLDDHDVTDDWNITAAWRHRVDTRPAGRRIVANALAAYWACQGWGNDPGVPPKEDFVDGVTAFAGPGEDDERARRFIAAAHGRGDWGFVAPTEPPALFLDTRTQRRTEGLGDDELPWLIDAPALARLGDRLRSHGHAPGEPLLVVSPTPVLGLAMVEHLQDLVEHVIGAAAVDFEAWAANQTGLAAFLQTLLEIGPGRCTILSGDVHYGFTTWGEFELGGRRLVLEQLTASPLKSKSESGTNRALGHLFRWDGHETLRGEFRGTAWSLKREKFLHADDGGHPLTVDTHIGLLEIAGGRPVRNHLLTPGRWTVTLREWE